MASATLNVKRWGNSLAVRIPARVAKEARLGLDQAILVSAEGGRVVIEPIGEPIESLAAKLARFDPAIHGGEDMATKPIGAEIW